VCAAREPLDQEFDVLAQQRLAAGEAILRRPARQSRASVDFFEAQQGRVREERVVLVEHFRGMQ
jgi:hypothetical protein